jgi:hypothetical protein
VSVWVRLLDVITAATQRPAAKRAKITHTHTHTHTRKMEKKKRKETHAKDTSRLFDLLKNKTNSFVYFLGASIIVNDDDDDAILASHYRVSSVYRLNSHLDSNNPRGAVYRGTTESRSK